MNSLWECCSELDLESEFCVLPIKLIRTPLILPSKLKVSNKMHWLERNSNNKDKLSPKPLQFVHIADLALYMHTSLPTHLNAVQHWEEALMCDRLAWWLAMCFAGHINGSVFLASPKCTQTVTKTEAAVWITEMDSLRTLSESQTV